MGPVILPLGADSREPIAPWDEMAPESNLEAQESINKHLESRNLILNFLLFLIIPNTTISIQYAQYWENEIMKFFIVFSIIKAVRWWLWSKRKYFYRLWERTLWIKQISFIHLWIYFFRHLLSDMCSQIVTMQIM